jgi:hypothetical protein
MIGGYFVIIFIELHVETGTRNVGATDFLYGKRPPTRKDLVGKV